MRACERIRCFLPYLRCVIWRVILSVRACLNNMSAMHHFASVCRVCDNDCMWLRVCVCDWSSVHADVCCVIYVVSRTSCIVRVAYIMSNRDNADVFLNICGVVDAAICSYWCCCEWSELFVCVVNVNMSPICVSSYDWLIDMCVIDQIVCVMLFYYLLLLCVVMCDALIVYACSLVDRLLISLLPWTAL